MIYIYKGLILAPNDIYIYIKEKKVRKQVGGQAQSRKRWW